MSAVQLILTPEFGGTAFGPFAPGHVALGSDPDQCHIVLPAALGIDPVHAWVTIDASGGVWLQPAAQGSALFLRRNGQVRGTLEPVPTTVQLGLGDAFALVAEDGPRFVLQAAAPASSWPVAPTSGTGTGTGAVPGSAERSGASVPTQYPTRPQPAASTTRGTATRGPRGIPTADAMGREVKRQLGAEAMTNGPVQDVMRLFYRMQTGALFQPRYIVAGAVALVGALFSGCAGLGALLSQLLGGG